MIEPCASAAPGREGKMETRVPRLFVSAVSADLRTVRKLVARAATQMGCLPVSMEEFFPQDHTAVADKLRKLIRECDAVLHFAGECYGSEPRERAPGQTRRSFTQMEYDIARELKIPCYVFVLPHDFPYDQLNDDGHLRQPEAVELKELQEAHRTALLQADRDCRSPKNLHDTEKAVLLLRIEIEALKRRIKDIDGNLTTIREMIQVLTDSVAKIGRQQGEGPETGYEQALGELAKRYGISVEELERKLSAFSTNAGNSPQSTELDKARAAFVGKNFLHAAQSAGDTAARLREARISQQKEEQDAWLLSADAYFASGDFTRAALAYRARLELMDRNDAQKKREWIQAANSAAWAYQQAGDHKASLALTEESLSWAESAAGFGPDHDTTYVLLNSLAVVTRRLRHFDRSLILHLRIVDHDTRKFGSNHPQTLSAKFNLAAIYDDMNRYQEAEAIYRHVLEERRSRPGSQYSDVAIVAFNLALNLERQGNLVEARQFASLALDEERKTRPDSHPYVREEIEVLARLDRALGKQTR
jgi:tetratricopeptide (TPR) repeat protein